jgi:hypothetical protein
MHSLKAMTIMQPVSNHSEEEMHQTEFLFMRTSLSQWNILTASFILTGLEIREYGRGNPLS